MVLNQDGTPNPDPIIDVYGTRRGPKQRPRNITKPTPKEKNSGLSLPNHAPPPLPLFQPSYGVIPQQSGNLPVPYPYGCIMPNPFPVNNNSNSLLPKFPQTGGMSTQNESNILDSRRNSPNENYDHFLGASSQYYHVNNNTSNNNNIVSNSNALREIDIENSVQKENSNEISKLGTGEHASFLSTKAMDADPLDLSKPEAMDISSEASVTYAAPSILYKSASKHRRKGQAYKLDYISRKLQQQTITSDTERTKRKYSLLLESEESPLSPEKTDNSINPHHTQQENVHNNQHLQSEMRKMNEKLPKVDEKNRNANEKIALSSSKAEVYCCDHCDIAFSDVVLYSMHKGYHGYQDPFKCNMCGVQTANKVEFFLHIARSSHS
jgi:hunchback-like protein